MSNSLKPAMVLAPSNGNQQKTSPGIKIGSYDILGSIGQGNFSVCKLAKSRVTNQMVAIKCVVKKNVDSAHLARIYREIEIMKALDHPNIIKLNQVMESKSMLYLVCEYAQNGELFDFIQKHGAMSEKMACEKFCQIISAVEYCHVKNIVHRDLKSENLLFDSKMNIKLVDFGFANYFDLINPLKTFCGSPPYAAPELFCGKKYYGPEVDIWSMGVILYVLVTGSLPFDSENLQYLKQRILNCKYRVPYSMSHDCENLISHILISNQSKRYKLQQIKLHKWIKANSPSFYYMSFNNSNISNNSSSVTNSFENDLLDDTNYGRNSGADSSDMKNLSIYIKMKKKSSSFKTKSFKNKLPNTTSATMNKSVELNSNKQNTTSNNVNSKSQVNNLGSPNYPQYSNSQINDSQENENLFPSPNESKAKHPALSCISLPLFSFEEYNSKENQTNLMSTISNANLANLNSLYKNGDNSYVENNIFQQDSTNKSSTGKYNQLESDESTRQESINKECALNTQMTTFINSLELNKPHQKKNLEQSNVIEENFNKQKPELKPQSSLASQQSFEFNKSIDLKFNFKNHTFAHLFSNSSSVDEGVESDLSSLSSSISSDLFSLSRNSNCSIQISSIESKTGQKILNQPVYGLIKKISHRNNIFLGSLAGRNYRRQKFANFKQGLIKSSRMKNLNDLAQIKNELNFLIEDSTVSLNVNNTNNNANNSKFFLDYFKTQPHAISQNKDYFPNIKDNNINNNNNNNEIQALPKSNSNAKQFNFFKCFKKKTDADFISAFNKLALVKRRKNLLKQTSISLNSINEDILDNLSKEASHIKTSFKELKLPNEYIQQNISLSSDLKFGRKHSLKN